MHLSGHHTILARVVEETITSTAVVMRDTIRVGLMEGQDPDVIEELLATTA